MTGYRALLESVAHAGVNFILVGAAAAAVHGAKRMTPALDVVYERSEQNLRRLAEALRPHAPYLRGAPAGLPFRWEEQTILQGLNFTLTTSLGDIDLLGEITGGGEYDRLLPYTIVLRPFGIECRCLTLDMLIHVKRAAGRPKDLEIIAELESIRGEGEG